jgi:hypothetical protein
MKKPDIAKLVTEQLKQEFERQQNANEQHSKSLKAGLHPMPLPEAKPRPTPEEVLALEKLRLWHLSFQERRMAREDAAWMLLGHKVKPLPEAKPTPEDEFKIERLSRWLFLFEGRIALGDAAGLLLGFSQTMTEDAKFVDANKQKRPDPKEPPPESRAPSRPVSSDLVTAFTNMRGHVEVALQKNALFADSDGKYGPADLIEWAKEKGFVADEVLAAWEAYKKAEAGEVKQVTAPARANGMTTQEIGAVFDGLPFSLMDWPKRASSAQWLQGARLSLGIKGGAPSMWCPLKVAQASYGQAKKYDQANRLKTLNNRFKLNPALAPWKDDWDNFHSMFGNED